MLGEWLESSGEGRGNKMKRELDFGLILETSYVGDGFTRKIECLHKMKNNKKIDLSPQQLSQTTINHLPITTI